MVIDNQDNYNSIHERAYFNTTPKSKHVFESTLNTYLIEQFRDCFDGPIKVLDIMCGQIPNVEVFSKVIQEVWDCDQMLFVDKHSDKWCFKFIFPRLTELNIKHLTYMVEDGALIPEYFNNTFDLVTNFRPNIKFIENHKEQEVYERLPELMKNGALFFATTYRAWEMKKLREYVRDSGLNILSVNHNIHDRWHIRHARVLVARKD